MPLVKPSCVRDLKARIDIVEVVSRVATLKRAGSRFKGLCPFHTEKTPSFHVDPNRGLYKCFGCGKGGDIFAFVQETEGLTFTESVEALGQRFGVPIEYEEGAGPSAGERSLRQELFDLHELAAEHFHAAFKARSPAGDFLRDYWVQQRRFPLEVADEFKIGAADENGSGLAAAVLKRGFSEDALRQSGLFFMRDGAALTLGALRPRFRGRLMIPIRDHQGRVAAFTARQTKLTPADDPAAEAKYVNSPETPIFTKGHLLFNLDRARTAVKDEQPFVMVEGQLDAIRCWHVGLRTAIAPQGTALTESQLILLRRYQPRIECLFDSDGAGQKAAERLVPLALKAGMEVRFLALGGDAKVDPDVLFLERGLTAYEELRRHALSAMGYICRRLLPERERASPEEKFRAAEALFAIVGEADSAVARSEFLHEAAGHLSLPAGALERDFGVWIGRRMQRGAPASPATAAASPGGAGGAVTGRGAGTSMISPEQHLLLLLLHFETLGPQLGAIIPHDWVDADHPAGALLNRFLGEFEHHTWPGRDHLDSLLETPAERALVAQLLFEPPATEEPEKAAVQALTALRARFFATEQARIKVALAKADQDATVDALSLNRRLIELTRTLREPIHLAAAI